MTTPRFVTAVRSLPGAGAPVTPGAGIAFTDEYVEGAEGSKHLIRGVPTPTRGELHVVTGDSVTVMWKRGVPFMILNLNSRKGSGHDVTDEGGGIVEELIRAPLEAPTGFLFPDTDVWFRNAEVVAPLRLTALLGVSSVEFGPSRGWGAQKRHFLVQSGSNTLHVIKVTGEPDSIQTDAPTATLVSTFDLEASALPLGNVRVHSAASGFDITTAVSLGPLLTFPGYVVNWGINPIEKIEGSVSDAYLNDANEVVITVDVFIRFDPNFIVLGPAWSYPVVVNVTTGQILFNGLTDHGGLPAPTGVVLDGTDFDRDAWVSTDYGLDFGLLPLIDQAGEIVNAVAGVAYSAGAAGSVYFAALLTGLGGGPSQTLVPLRVSGAAPQGNGDRLWVMSEDQRYVLWVHSVRDSPVGVIHPLDKIPAPTASTYDPARMTDFVNFQDVAVANLPLTFAGYVPVLLAPSLLFVANKTPADATKTDVATEFAEFRSSTGTIVLHQAVVEVSGTEDASKLKDYAEVPEAAFIPQYLADWVEDPTDPATNLGSLLGFLKYQTIEDTDTGFDFPDA